MKKIIFSGLILIFVTIALLTLTQKQRTTARVIGDAQAPTLRAETHSPALPKHVITHSEKDLEKEVMDLQHEVEHGEYVRRINTRSTSEEEKLFLRTRIRLMAEKTLKLTELRTQRMRSLGIL